MLRALRAELGKDKADAIVKQALHDRSRRLFAGIGVAPALLSEPFTVPLAVATAVTLAGVVLIQRR